MGWTRNVRCKSLPERPHSVPNPPLSTCAAKSRWRCYCPDWEFPSPTNSNRLKRSCGCGWHVVSPWAANCLPFEKQGHEKFPLRSGSIRIRKHHIADNHIEILDCRNELP